MPAFKTKKALALTLALFLVLLASPNPAKAAEEEEDNPDEDAEDAEEEMMMEPGMQKMSFKPPQLNEEEERSPHLLEEMSCDSCKAVAFQLHKTFQEGHKNFKRQDYRLPESEVLDRTEKTCTYQNFEAYGIAPVDGANKLKGPGVYDGAGIVQMGGKMPFRLSELCAKFMDLDEMRIYEHWVTNGRTDGALKDFLCVTENDHCRSRRDEL